MHNLFSFCLLALDCPLGWDELEDSCYKMMTKFQYSAKLSWEDARAVCVGLEGDLVSIDNEKEMEFIKNISSKFRFFELWIGLNDRLKEDQFVWSDGTPFNRFWSYNNWNYGEPNNSGNEDCVVLHKLKWNDLSCFRTIFYICERPKGGLLFYLFCFRNANYIHLDKAPLTNR